MKFLVVLAVVLAALPGCKSPTSASIPTTNGRWGGFAISPAAVPVGENQDTVDVTVTSADSCGLALMEKPDGTISGTGTIQWYNIVVMGQDTTLHLIGYSSLAITGKNIYPRVGLALSMQYESVVIPLTYTGTFAKDDLIIGTLSDQNGNFVAMSLTRTK